MKAAHSDRQPEFVKLPKSAGVHLTKAGAVLLDASRAVLSLVDQEVDPAGGGPGTAAATAALVWSGDLPRTLQQILFDTAESIISPGPVRQAEPELKARSLSATHLGQAPPGGRGSGT
jgi:hypothetical protein